MSHVVEIQTEIRGPVALRAACDRLGLSQPEYETVSLFSGQATGFVVRLPDWRYPVVCDPQTGQVKYDNFAGRWGEQCELDLLLQAYAIEKTRIESHKQGHSVREQRLADGSVKLTVEVGGDV